MNDEEVEVTFKFPRELVEKADLKLPIDHWRGLVGSGKHAPVSRLSYLLCAQVLEWQQAQKHVVTAGTPAGADVIYTNKDGEEFPAVLVAHRRNAEAWIWISSDPSNYLLNLIKLEDLRLAEGGGQ